MAMSNNDTYTLTVMWGKFNVLDIDNDTTEQRFCWHAIATHTRFISFSVTVPTGWTNTSPDTAETTTLECYADTWSEMSTKLSVLATFWNE